MEDRTIYLVPRGPGFPEGPIGPVGPGRPRGPSGPGKPCNWAMSRKISKTNAGIRAAIRLTVSPILPGGPLCPGIPGAPGLPDGPFSPGMPGDPARPSSPALPRCPEGPGGPEGSKRCHDVSYAMRFDANSITLVHFFTCRLCHPRRPFPRGPGHLLVRVCPTDRDLLAVRAALQCRADQFGLGVRRRQQVPLYRDCLVRRSLQRVRAILAILARPPFQADRAVHAVPSRKMKCS